MLLKNVLDTLKENNVRLGLEGDQLKIRAAKGAMTPEIKQLLVENKSELLTWIKSKHAESDAAAPIQRRDTDAELVLSFAQQRLWFIDQLDPNNVAYNIPAAVRIKGQLDIRLLKRVFDEIILRHEILRTTYHNDNGIARQVIHQSMPCKLQLADLQATDNLDEAITSLAKTEAIKPFDLSNGPLIKIKIVRLNPQDANNNTDDFLLILNLHHIVTDGWSNGVLLSEVSALYEAFKQDRESPLPELPIQYADYAIWQRQNLPEETLAEKTAYWREKLADVAVSEIPTDFPRPAQRSGQGAQIEFSVDISTTQSAKALAKQQGATLFIVLMAAFKTLLHRYSNQTDICVGTPVAGRGRAEISPLIGFFVNTLALRTDLSGDPSFIELITRVQAEMLDGNKHQDVPFENIVDALGLSRDMSVTPVFQSLLVLQNTPVDQSSSAAGLTFEPISTDSKSSKTDLSFNISEVESPKGSSLAVSVEYDTDLFVVATINRLITHFQTLLSGIVDNPEQSISQLPMMTAEEHQQIINEWSGQRKPYPRNLSMAAQVEQYGEKTPDAIALDFSNEQLSYLELNQRANQLAHYLQAKGVKTNDLVVVCLGRSVEMIVSALAIIKLGAAYIPLDPDYPQDRLVFMLEDTASKLVITRSQNLDRLQALPMEKLPEFIVVDSQREEISREPLQWQSNKDNLNGEALAYIMYTSGSTGKPKGVMVPQRGIIRLVKNTNYMEYTPQDAFAHISNVSFDATTFEIWGALLNGGRVVGIDADVVLSQSQFRDVLVNKKVTAMCISVTLFNLYVSQEPGMFATVKNLLVGGEAQDPNKMRSVLASDPPPRLINAYGPTENSVLISCYEVKQLAENASSVPIGHPVTNSTLYILDQHSQPVPIGIPGEICTGGDGVALGYLNRDDLTAEKFIPDPFAQQPGKLMYRTGDIGRWLPNGTVDIIGRVDNQVKIRGHRIELGEIENALGSLAQIRESAVLAREDQPGNKYLAAYVMPMLLPQDKEAMSQLVQDIRTQLRILMPAYMQPNALVLMDEFPRTSSEKLDRKALPIPDSSELVTTEYIAPRNDDEEKIAAIWRDVLNVKKVGILDDFFELGGHSLIATQAIARLSDAFDLNLPLRLLFEASTIETFTQEVARLRSSGGIALAPPISTALRQELQDKEHLPLSFAQQRLWVIDQIQPGTAMYNIPTEVRIRGKLNIEALQLVFKEIVQRHETLRTTFGMHNNDAYQTVHDGTDWFMEVQVAQETLIDTAFIEGIAEFKLRPFDLSTGPLFRVQLIQLSKTADDFVLLTCMHHIISDGWSYNVLMSEMMALYQAFSMGEATPLANIDIQYADYALWQRQWLEGDVIDTQVDYWREKLADTASLSLPTDHPRPRQTSAAGQIIDFDLDPKLSQQLRDFCHQESATLFMTLMAAFQLLLARYSRQDDISVGSPIANRTQQALEPLIGFFVNTLVFRTQIDGKQSFTELLKDVKQTALDAYQNQDVPFERLLDELDVARELNQTPLFQTMFTLQSSDQEIALTGELNFGDISIGALNLDSDHAESAAKFDITLGVVDNENQLIGSLEYRSELFEASTIKHMIDHYKNILTKIVVNPSAKISELTFLSDQEEQKLLIDWSTAAETDYPIFPVHQRFEEQAALHPDAIAVSCASETISYQHLNERANQVARELQARGIKVGDFVGLCLDRSIDLMVGLLGILKAGGAYIPLDPHFPAERLAYILEDSKASVLISATTVATDLAIDQVEQLLLDSQADQISQHNIDNLDLAIPTESSIYVLYTSGTTGKPKGCVVTHANVARLFSATDDDFGFDKNDVWTLFHSYAFDFTVWEIWGALFYGGKLVIVPYIISRSPEEFYQLLVSEQVTVLNQTPSAFSQLIAVDSQKHQDATLALRYVVFGGEALDFNALKTWVEIHGFNQPQLINMYGITETTVHVTLHRITEQDLAAQGSNIGRPIKDLQVYILDHHGHLAAPGVPGEMHISGPGVTNGYLQRDDLTAEKFIHNPFLEQLPEQQRANHQTLYRSGDLGRYTANGDIDYLGRIDFQVKIRGHRIELGEITAAITQLDVTREAVVLVQGDGDAKRLISYLLLAEGVETLDINLTRNQLRAHLPDYMIPAAFITMEQWPLTATGKIDTKALPEPDSDVFASTPYVEPSTETQVKLVKIWSELLQLETIGVQHNFFELGGHSLLAVKLASIIRETYDVEIPVSAIFEASTIEGMAGYIENIFWARGDQDPVSEDSNEDREEFEL